MKKEEDQVDISSQKPLLERHVIKWDKNLTQLQDKGNKNAIKRIQNAKNQQAAEDLLIEAKSEVDEVKIDFSKKQLLDMIIPAANKSKHKAGKVEKDSLEVRKSFSHVLKKVKKREVKQVPSISHPLITFCLLIIN